MTKELPDGSLELDDGTIVKDGEDYYKCNICGVTMEDNMMGVGLHLLREHPDRPSRKFANKLVGRFLPK